MDNVDEIIEKQLSGSTLTPKAKEDMKQLMRDRLTGQKQDTQKPKEKTAIVSKPKKIVQRVAKSLNEDKAGSKKVYKPTDRTQVTFFINNNVHQKLKDICEANRSRGIKTAVSDIINLSIIKHLDSLEK